MEAIEIDIDPKAYIRDLNNGAKQMVEIVRAVSQNSRMVIMDEPTSSLSDHEVQALFKVMRKLKSENVAIIYISHRLKEILEMGDTLTVLRDGTLVDTVPVSEVTEDKMVAMMVGREISNYYFKPEPPKTKEIVFEVRNLTRAGMFNNVSFKLYKGEILGVAGLIGAGRTEVMRAAFGADPYDSGECLMDGKPYKAKTPKATIKKGLGLIPEDRRGQGLLLEKNVKENTSLASLFANSNHGFINFGWEKQESVSYIEKLRIKTPSELALLKNLSGGNQQKVIIGRWLLTQPEILMLDEPTRGIDVGAKFEIYQLIAELAKKDKGIIIISSEMPELLGITDRILVMSNGLVAGIVDTKTTTQNEILRLASLHL